MSDKRVVSQNISEHTLLHIYATTSAPAAAVIELYKIEAFKGRTAQRALCCFCRILAHCVRLDEIYQTMHPE